MKRLAMVVAVLLIAVGMVLAHGEPVRVLGTVTAISPKSITVQTVDKKLSVVEITAATKFVKSGVAASIKDLKVVDRGLRSVLPAWDDVVEPARGPELF